MSCNNSLLVLFLEFQVMLTPRLFAISVTVKVSGHMSWQHYLENNNHYSSPSILEQVYATIMGLHKIMIFFLTAVSSCAGSCKIS